MVGRMKSTSVLFVCLGNICRSPLAEGIFRHLVAERGLDGAFTIDSCGTSAYHVGEPPHKGSQEIARARGVSLEGQRSRQVCDEDFDRFDWLVAMDVSNRNNLRSLAARNGVGDDNIVLLLDYAQGDAPREVPDPYYVGGFDVVFDYVKDGCEGLLEMLEAR